MQAAGAELDRLAARIDAWGDEGARREQERRAARGELDPPTVPSFRAVAMPEGSFAQMVANRRARLGRKPKRG